MLNLTGAYFFFRPGFCFVVAYGPGGSSHNDTLPLEFLCPLLLLGFLAVDLQADRPALLQIQQFLEELLHVVIRLGRGFHEAALPPLGLGLAVTGLHLSQRVVALVAHQHDGDALHVPLDLAHLFVDGLQLFQRLLASDGVNEDEGVPFGDGEALHGGELVTPCGVGDL